MAWLEKTTSGHFHVGFRHGGLKYKKALRTKDAEAASARAHRVAENLMLLETGRLHLPADADIGAFLLADGRQDAERPIKAKRKLRLLGQLAKTFMASIPDGALEASTIKGMQTHLRHLRRVLGTSFDLPSLELGDLQAYVDTRGKDKGKRGKCLSAATIRKELTTLRTLWNWSKDAGHLKGQLALKGIRFPKETEKPPFQTLAEIERRIARGMLTDAEQDELWCSLFLTTPELAELLNYVRETARHDFVYPMFVFSAHTGARRSEILRSRLDDIDFAEGQILVREKKRVRGRATTRRVPLSPLLRQVLREYLPMRPGGQYTFAAPADMERSRNKKASPEQITRDQAHDHFKRAVSGSRWSEARGWHVFRHSFCSNCAAAGIDQRLINAWVGHQTEEMVKRYRHLIPDQQQRAIAEVFPE